MTRKTFLGRLAAAGVVLTARPWPLLQAAAAGDARTGLTRRPLAPPSRGGGKLFTLLAPEVTGIRTENPYDDPRMWGDRYNANETGGIGTGIAIGDYDGDGRPDIFVVSKTRSCRLFRNLGNWRFEDVTEQAGVGDKGPAAAEWKQGATWVDVNNDGLLDLYVCRFNAPNLLYINQGDGTFREEAAKRGLAVKDACVMAAFCDYDRDGFLDVFIQTNLLDADTHPNGQSDYLFHNNGDGTFTDVTARAGIGGEAQGHSAIWWDFDGDGWPDLYVANDFAMPDKLYRNNRDGTFMDVIDEVVPHMPYSAMGSDLGDVDNDGRIDLFVADMAPTSAAKDLRTVAVMRSYLTDPPEGAGVAPQVMRNALYLNTGTGRMLEGACLAGLAATDWTWSVRLEDLDNDGRLDVYVTNGMNRESHNADLTARKTLAASAAEKIRLEQVGPVLKERHLAFRNLGDLRFEECAAAWGLDEVGVAFGAAFGDLDGDGDLDLVHANYDGGVSVLRNDSADGHRIVLELRGTRSNRFGVGSLVRLETEAGVQVRSLVLARGVLSNSEPVLHFGLGADTRIRRLTIEWPSGAVQTFSDLPADYRYTATEPVAPPVAGLAGVSDPGYNAERPRPLFVETSAAWGLVVRSNELPIDESVQQPLLPFRQNHRGPAIAAGDIAGQGRDDLVVGGTTRDGLRVFLADGRGGWAPGSSPARGTEIAAADGPVLLFDATGRGRADLLVTKAGTTQPAGSADYQPVLWLNDGAGQFARAPDGTLPELPVSAGAAAAADFERSGRLGLFIGGRVVPGDYPSAPVSALLAWRGGRFRDVTDELAPELRRVGLVTSAIWTDVDGDGWPDLLLTLEWGGVKYFRNREGRRFEDWSERAGFASAGTGWWTALAAADFDGDGRMEYVVGNVGLNTPYQADRDRPALLFAGDFTGEGDRQLVEAVRDGGRLVPRRSRRELAAVIPSILRRFRTNDAYAAASLEEIVGADALARADRWSATELRSGIFRRDGERFVFEALPRRAQIAPFQGLVAGDFDGDGCADVFAVQNSYAPAPPSGRFDGGLGQFLRGDGRGGLAAVGPAESGLMVPGDAKALVVVGSDERGAPGFIVSRNQDTLLAFRPAAAVTGRAHLSLALRAGAGNPTGIGARVRVESADGRRQTAEIHCGGGYWSQSSPTCHFGFDPARPLVRAEVSWPTGAVSRHALAPGERRVVLSAPTT